MKKLLAILLLIIPSCQQSRRDFPVNTEIFCPNSAYRFLVLESSRLEVEKSIQDAIEYNEKSNKRNNYTVLYFPNKRNTSIYGITPQEIRRDCILTERNRKKSE